MVEDSQIAAARTVIEQTDRSRQTDPQLTGRETAVALAAGTLGLLGAVLVGDTPPSSDSQETTRCLACNAIMAESEETCRQCGWSYAQGDGLELFEDEPPDED
jgi:hypothetical protein